MCTLCGSTIAQATAIVHIPLCVFVAVKSARENLVIPLVHKHNYTTDRVRAAWVVTEVRCHRSKVRVQGFFFCDGYSIFYFDSPRSQKFGVRAWWAADRVLRYYQDADPEQGGELRGLNWTDASKVRTEQSQKVVGEGARDTLNAAYASQPEGG